MCDKVDFILLMADSYQKTGSLLQEAEFQRIKDNFLRKHHNQKDIETIKSISYDDFVPWYRDPAPVPRYGEHDDIGRHTTRKSNWW